MKKLLFATALAMVACAAPAYADIVVTGVSTPDGDGSGSVTTNGYSNYTGPIEFTIQGGGTITVYCADLNHVLSTPTTYAFVPLTQNGLGQTITEQVSNEIGQIAAIGLAAFKAGGTLGLDEAAAAQAAIWDLEYSTTSAATGQIATDIADLLAATYVNTGTYALALQPVGQGWYGNPSASQQMIVGLDVPEPATWAIELIGFLGLGYAAFRKGKSARTGFADA